MRPTDEIIGYVIMSSTGEYSDRVEMPIRFVSTEDEAQAMVSLADIEKQQPYERPKYRSFERRHPFVGGFYHPEDKAESDRLMNQHYSNVRALGHVDPEGASPRTSYFYEPVYRYAGKAIKDEDDA